MLVLQIITGLIILAGLLGAFLAFNEHCENKFDYCFFTMTSFLVVGASLIIMWLGNEWRLMSIQENGDIFNGILVMGIGGIIALFLVYRNFKKTNLVYGLGGSTVQLAVFGALAYFGVFVLITGLVVFVLASVGVRPVYVVNK